jgi:hypothetical protein
MDRRSTLVSLALVLLCGGILVLFTDVELKIVQWVNCGPLASSEARRAPLCKRHPSAPLLQ